MTTNREIERRSAAARAIASAPVPVYFAQYGFEGLIKIGTSMDVRKRLDTIQSMCPVALQLLGWTVGGYAVERQMHDRFRSSRAWGEWFGPTHELTTFCRDELRHDEPPIIDWTTVQAAADAIYMSPGKAAYKARFLERAP